jgi:hypothetical protein
MKKRHVFSTENVGAAQRAVGALRRAGVSDSNISLIAEHGADIPDEQKDVGDDFNRGGLKGVLAGGGSGLLVGLIAVAVPSLGVTLTGAAVMTLVGAAVGGWVGMLTGTAEPSPVRRKFAGEIAAGRVLVVVDGNDEKLAAAAAALLVAGATSLPFDQPAAMS